MLLAPRLARAGTYCKVRVSECCSRHLSIPAIKNQFCCYNIFINTELNIEYTRISTHSLLDLGITRLHAVRVH